MLEDVKNVLVEQKERRKKWKHSFTPDLFFGENVSSFQKKKKLELHNIASSAS